MIVAIFTYKTTSQFCIQRYVTARFNNMLTTLLAAERAPKERGAVAPPEEEVGRIREAHIGSVKSLPERAAT